MVGKVDTALVTLWGHTAGAVAWLPERDYAVFEFDPAFLELGLDISPIHMGLEAARSGNALFSFPALNRDTYLGLPGLLADALPDKFGNRIIDAWLARNHRDSSDFSPVERLCYTGRRGMGALEFAPATIGKYDTATPLEVAQLVELTEAIMRDRHALDTRLGATEQDNTDALLDILRVGTSAGGARPKAVIAMDASGKVMSGQTRAPAGFDYWILKFDGVTDLELGEPKHFGRIEYAYHLMAQDAGIRMSECRLLEEHGRAHFMTRRFDRVNGDKLHLQSLCGIAHYDFNMTGAYSYEQAFAIMRRLRLSKADAAEQYRRMVFNVMARNLDDHTKNIAFLMGPDGRWRLSPAFDVIYAHNPKGRWTSRHQMSVNGKREGINRRDLLAVADNISLPHPESIIENVAETVERWPEFAKTAGVPDRLIRQIRSEHRVHEATV